MEIGTGLTILGSAIGSAQLLEKILGPTADYLGEGLQGWTERRVQNVAAIFRAAARKLGPELDSEGAVPPRVLGGIIADGSFCEDPLMADYFGGVLASARSSVPRDDRAASYAALIGRLSTYQVRTHYIFYSVVKRLFDGSSLHSGATTARTKLLTFVPEHVYRTAMDFSEEESEKFWAIAAHSFLGLAKENLVANELFAMGSDRQLQAAFPQHQDMITSSGFIFFPSPYGIDLFMWAHGYGDRGAGHFLLPEQTFKMEPEILIPDGSLALRSSA